MFLMCVQYPNTYDIALGCCHKHDLWAVLEQSIDAVDAEERATSIPVALGHEKSTGIVLKAIRTLRHQKAGIGDAKMTKTPHSRKLPLPDNVRVVEDGVYSEVSVPSARPVRKTHKIKEIPRIVSDGFAEITIPTLDATPPPLDGTRIPQVPTYPAIPPLQSSNATDGTRQAHGLTMSRRKPLPKSSTVKLSPVAEHKPSTYEPTPPTGARDAEPVDSAKTDNVEDGMISGLLSVPKQDRYSRTSTMSSAISAKSHEGPGAIYIRPSAQLESMQCISELDKKLRSAARCRHGWQTMGRKNGGRVHTPTGTPESISNIPLNAQVYRAHSRLNRTIQTIPDVADRVSMQDWAKSSEWIEPCSTAPGPTEWIEDFLTRKEQADRAESDKKRKQKRENGILRGNSLNNFVRRLSGKKVVDKRKSFEARRGNTEESVMRRMPERTRALSWDVVPQQAMATAQDTHPDRSSPKQALSPPEPPPRLCAENRPHTSPAMLYRSPTFHEPVAAASTTTGTESNTHPPPPPSQPSSSPPQRQQHPPLPRLPSFSPSPQRHRHRPQQQQQQHHHHRDAQTTRPNNKTNTTTSNNPSRTKSLSKARFKSLSSSMGTGVKRSLSVSRAPARADERHGGGGGVVQGLLGRMGKKIEDGFRRIGGGVGVGVGAEGRGGGRVVREREGGREMLD